MSAPTSLLERDTELEAIAQALGCASGGRGSLLTIEGEAGAGKTAVLEVAAKMAADAGFRVLRAAGGQLERDFPYGIVRQLFESLLAADDRRTRLLAGNAAMAAAAFEPGLESVSADRAGIQNGTYWLLANMAESGPVAVLIDDAHWGDRASLQAIVYCSRRLADLPVAVLTAARHGEPDAPDDLLAELGRHAAMPPLTPAPLSNEAARQLIAAKTGDRVEEDFADSARRVTAGNPLLLVELLSNLSAEELQPSARNVERVVELASGGMARSVVSRLGGLGDDATAVARAIAVLEPNAELRTVAAMSGLSPAAVAEGSDRLIAAGLIADGRPLAFVHPLIRSAVAASMPAPSRAVAHANAARLLADHGAAVDSVAAHLLLSEPDGSEWVVRTLRRAATEALGRGVPEAAVRYLRRGLREQAGTDAAIERELGLALLRNSDGDGVQVLQRVQEQSRDRSARIEVAATLASALALRNRSADAAELLERSLADAGDRSSRGWLRLRQELVLLMVLGLETVPDGAIPDPGADLALSTTEGRSAAGILGFLYLCGLGEARRGRELARAAAADLDAVDRDSMAGFPPQATVVALALADCGDATEALCEVGVAAARRRGAMLAIPANRAARALSRYLDGDLSGAAADVEFVVGLWEEASVPATRVIHASVAIRVMTARGDDEGARDLVAREQSRCDAASGLPAAAFRCANAESLLAAGAYAEARREFELAGEHVRWLPLPNPELLGWRQGLARIAAVQGDVESAEAEAARAVELARRAGGARGIGVALHAHGLVRQGGEAIDLLEQAVQVLEPTRARYRSALALVDLGSALRRANRRKDAREPLRRGMELAHVCGAPRLADRARAELEATGARPRSVLRSGVDALTPSETRVARLAAAGMSNREIAQDLFVTRKTVETHLRHVFQKLDLTDRRQLAKALADGGGEPAP